MLSAKENRNPGETKSRIETCQRQPCQIALNRMTRVTAMMAGQYIGLLNRISRAQEKLWSRQQPLKSSPTPKSGAPGAVTALPTTSLLTRALPALDNFLPLWSQLIGKGGNRLRPSCWRFRGERWARLRRHRNGPSFHFEMGQAFTLRNQATRGDRHP
jgi:hypothetical protein